MYLVVTPEPTDEFVAQRERVITSLVTDDLMAANLVAWVELVWLGLLSAAGPGREGVNAIVEAIQKQQPSFPSDPKERELDLRVTAAAALDRRLDGQSDNDLESRLTLAALVSAVSHFNALPAEPRFDDVVQSLSLKAQALLDEEALVVRDRSDPLVPTVDGPDLETVVRSMNVSLKAIHKSIRERMSADREELQVLWWLFATHSKQLRAPYAALASGDAALAAATELADLMLMPPVPAASEFLATMLKDRPTLSLCDLISQTSLPALGLLKPSTEITVVLQHHPALLPLTWLAARLVESDRSPWEAEFEKKTHLSPSISKPTFTWAEQVFRERVAAFLLGGDSQGE
jgi:hypothetical protein